MQITLQKLAKTILFLMAAKTSSARMRRIVGLFQPFRGDMRVHLRRDEVRVAEQLLHAAQVRARIQQVRCIAVPQLVRRQTWIQTGNDEKLFQPPRN